MIHRSAGSQHESKVITLRFVEASPRCSGQNERDLAAMSESISKNVPLATFCQAANLPYSSSVYYSASSASLGNAGSSRILPNLRMDTIQAWAKHRPTCALSDPAVRSPPGQSPGHPCLPYAHGIYGDDWDIPELMRRGRSIFTFP